VSSAKADRTADIVARLKKLRRDPQTGQPEAERASAIVARLKQRAPAPVLDQKPKSTWKVILGWTSSGKLVATPPVERTFST
jgi:hypothetical protein